MVQLRSRLAYERLNNSVTKGNLWLYILTELEAREASPPELRERVREKYGVNAASITFYTVIYRLKKEGLVRKSSDRFRSAYEVTAKGLGELERARKLISEVAEWVGQPSKEP